MELTDDEVQDLVIEVDVDSSGDINFEEFMIVMGRFYIDLVAPLPCHDLAISLRQLKPAHQRQSRVQP